MLHPDNWMEKPCQVGPTRHIGGLHTSGLTVAEWAHNCDTFGGILDEYFR
jgi:hypothetical protein